MYDASTYRSQTGNNSPGRDSIYPTARGELDGGRSTYRKNDIQRPKDKFP